MSLNADLVIDNKVVKKHYPSSNMDDQLVFTFEADPNLCLLKNKIAIHFVIELDEKYFPENGFAAKQFSSCSVELNSQRVSNNKTKGEYFLNDWLIKYGNFSPDYVETLFLEGFFDKYDDYALSANNKAAIVGHRREGIPKKGSKYVYEMIMNPNDPFLNENHPLPPGIELKLFFDRLPVEFSVIKTGADDPLKGKVLELKDVYAQVEYISSPSLRNLFDQVDLKPLDYQYDECTVICRSLPLNEQYIRLENLKGGNIPDYLFFALVKTESLNGSTSNSAFEFKNNGLKEVNLTLNGNSCLGFPVRIQNDTPIWPYYKFLDTLGRIHNVGNSRQWGLDIFKEKVLFSHKFEGEESNQGWLGITLSLSEPLSSQHTLILWTVHNVKTTIDKYCMIEKYNL